MAELLRVHFDEHDMVTVSAEASGKDQFFEERYRASPHRRRSLENHHRLRRKLLANCLLAIPAQIDFDGGIGHRGLREAAK